MGRIEKFVRLIDRLQSRIHLFVASIALLGTLLVGASLVAWHTSRQEEEFRLAFGNAAGLLRTTNDIRLATLNLLRGERGYLLTGKPDYLQPFTDGKTQLAGAMTSLEALVAHDPRLVADVSRLEPAVASYTERLERIVHLAQAGRHEQAMAMVHGDDGRVALLGIDAILQGILTRERAHLEGLEHRVVAADHYQSVMLIVVAAAGLCLILLASLTVVALRRSFARERDYRAELRRQAETDELTGLANRRELMASLDRAISLSRREGRSLAVAVLDIDHFKRVNDTFGHAAGDEVIRKVARTASATIRGFDIVGRLGGEEFAIVLLGAGVAQGYAVCERLRQRIHEEAIELADGQEIRVTISTGIAWLLPDDTSPSLIARADEALYDAKNGGRDQVRIAA